MARLTPAVKPKSSALTINWRKGMSGYEKCSSLRGCATRAGVCVAVAEISSDTTALDSVDILFSEWGGARSGPQSKPAHEFPHERNTGMSTGPAVGSVFMFQALSGLLLV